MTGFITSAGEDYLLELITGSGFTLPSYWIALIRNAPPTRHATGSELDEPLQTDYQRAYYENISGNWTERHVAVSNAFEIVFPPCQSEDWGLISHWAVCDADVGGRALWAGTLTTPIYVGAGDQVFLSPGQLTLRAVGYSAGVML